MIKSKIILFLAITILTQSCELMRELKVRRELKTIERLAIKHQLNRVERITIMDTIELPERELVTSLPVSIILKEKASQEPLNKPLVLSRVESQELELEVVLSNDSLKVRTKKKAQEVPVEVDYDKEQVVLPEQEPGRWWVWLLLIAFLFSLFMAWQGMVKKS